MRCALASWLGYVPFSLEFTVDALGGCLEYRLQAAGSGVNQGEAPHAGTA